ncbi:MAG TPA: insulinase family protein, partial [Bacteroidia bacterium]|nr:insulinase family protein [Bacteroidia bacterium]
KNWSGGAEANAPAPELSYTGGQKQFIEKEGAVQSAIRIGRRLFNRNHPDYPGMAVLNTVLGGYFGSRLMSNIREDKGYTYGIGSALVSMKQEGYFFISTEVGADVTVPALTEIYKEIDLLKTELVEEEELAMVRNYMRGTFLKGIENAFHLADRFRSLHLHGLGYDYYQKYLEKVRTIQPDEIKALANKYLDSGAFYELVVGRK